MDLLIPILIAAAVSLLMWGLTRAFTDGSKRERKRLTERLSNEGRADPIESGGNRPITRQLEVVGLPPYLAKQAFIQTINRHLLQAMPGTSLARFLMLALTAGFAGLFLGFLLTGSALVAIVAGPVALYIPFMILGRKRAKRQRQMALQLPEALDFLSRVLKAGHSFPTGLQMMAEELPRPLCEELRRCYDAHSLGQSMEDALKDTAARIDSTDFAFFVTSLLIQRQTGGDMSEVLKNISGMIRGRIRLSQQVKAKTAEGRFTGYILVAFPAVMFMLVWVQAPEQANKLLHGKGLYFLGTAFGLQMLGLWTIRKITTVKV